MSVRLRRCFLLLSITAAAMSALLCFLPAAGHDQLWFLLMAHRWLGGAQLYGPEIFDSNPPMVIWLSAVVQISAAVSHLGATFLAKSLLLALAGGIALLSSSLLSRLRPRLPSEIPALLFAFLVLFLTVPARDLGQRDALAVLLALPYVLLGGRRPADNVPPAATIFCALLAALAFCLKPQDALISVTLELGLLVQSLRGTRSLGSAVSPVLTRPEPALLIAIGLLYLFAIQHFAPLYLTSALPIVRETYWAIGGLSVAALLWQAVELVLLAAFTLLIVLRSSSSSPLVQALLLAGLGASLAYLVQGTGWYYQQIPAIDLFGCALALHLLDLQRRHPLRLPVWAVPALAALCVLAVALTTWFGGAPFTQDRAFSITSPAPAFFQPLLPGTPVAILTTSVDEAMMPVERYHLTWAQRTDNLWLLPALLRSQTHDPRHPPRRFLTPLTLARLDATQHRWMVEDLNRWQPQLILVERCGDPAVHCQTLEDRHDDLLAWFRRDPAFRILWQHYTFAGTRDRFDAYARDKTAAGAQD